MDVEKRIEELSGYAKRHDDGVRIDGSKLHIRDAMLQLAREVRDAAVAAKVGSVTALVKDLSDRKGLSDEWDQIDDDIKQEITDEWQEYVARAIRAAIRLPGEEK